MHWLESPEWLLQRLSSTPEELVDPVARMSLVIDLARENAACGSGGPFAAAVFERHHGRVLAAGVNRVVVGRCSHAHAEMIALAQAEQRLAHYDLSAPGLPECELVSSCEPCAMCLGAVIWSGVRSLRCGAGAADARAIGFDEGPRPEDWVEALRTRGIAVQTGLCADEARAVLERYRDAGAPIYGPARS